MTSVKVNVHDDLVKWLREMSDHYDTNITEIVNWSLSVAMWVESVRRKKLAALAVVEQVGSWLTGKIVTSTYKIEDPEKGHRGPDYDPKPPTLKIIKGDKI